MMTALSLIPVLGLLVGLARRPRARRMQVAMRAGLGLRAVHRRLQSAQFRSQVKTDAARLRRELDRDMSAYDKEGERHDH